MQDTIVVLCQAWGPVKGGINAFNADLCRGLAAVCGRKLNVVCLVKNVTAEAAYEAANDGILLIQLAYEHKPDEFSAPLVQTTLEQEGICPSRVLLWIGHDRFTGLASCELATEHNGRSAVIRHMDYALYGAIRQSGEAALSSARYQQSIFQQAHHLFAVGPLLRAGTEIFLSPSDPRKVHTLVPGLASIEKRRRPTNLFLITYDSPLLFSL